MKASIVIVTYNSLNLIDDCLASIFKFNDIGDSLDVIIVDNNSPDQKELFNFIKVNYKNRPIKLFDAGINGGYGKGNNYGISKTDADIIIVMNPDVRFIHPILGSVLNKFEDESIGMVGFEFIDGSKPYYFKPEYDSFLHSLFSHVYTYRRKYDCRKMYMSGSIMAFNRKTFIEAGKYDENIFMYYEEPDITNRIIKTGKRVVWLKGIMVEHLAHGRKFNQKLAEITHKSLKYYCKKYNIDIIHQYNIQKRILKIKIVLSILICDKQRKDFFTQTLKRIPTEMS